MSFLKDTTDVAADCKLHTTVKKTIVRKAGNKTFNETVDE